MTTPEQNDAIFNEVQALCRDAWWYACGRRHGGGLADPWEFSNHYGQFAQRFLSGKTSFRPSIPDAYSSYCAARLEDIHPGVSPRHLT